MNKYNVGDKFLINIKELVKSNNNEMLYKSDCYGIIFSEEQLDKLQKYENDVTQNSEAYIKGLEDAWNLVRKVFTTEQSILQKVFGHSDEGYIIMTFEPQEALDKLEAYEKTKEINVGDVIEFEDGTKAVVLDWFDDEIFALLTENGCVQNWNKKSDFKKTGKHIDITSVLEQLRRE